MSEFNVGQTLYITDTDTFVRLVTIEKVGRKWLTIDKGYASPGQCWLSEEDYSQHTALHKTWQTFRDRVVECRYRGPDGMTIEKINQASAILFGE